MTKIVYQDTIFVLLSLGITFLTSLIILYNGNLFTLLVGGLIFITLIIFLIVGKPDSPKKVEKPKREEKKEETEISKWKSEDTETQLNQYYTLTKSSKISSHPSKFRWSENK